MFPVPVGHRPWQGSAVIRSLPDGFELDAHGLYEQFGFGRPDAKVMERLP